MIKKLNAENFENEIKDEIVIVDFYADWCGPCRMVAPILEEIANERADITIGKVNVDEELALAEKFKVVSIPTMILFKNGIEQSKIVGYRPKEEILALL